MGARPTSAHHLSADESDALPRMERLAGGGAEQRRERARRRISIDAVASKPLLRLRGRERYELDLREAPPRPRHGRMQLTQIVVRRHQHDHAETLADDAVDD